MIPHQGFLTRLDRAHQILQEGREIKDFGNGVFFMAASDGDGGYLVQPELSCCTCPDYVHSVAVVYYYGQEAAIVAPGYVPDYMAAAVAAEEKGRHWHCSKVPMNAHCYVVCKHILAVQISMGERPEPYIYGETGIFAGSHLCNEPVMEAIDKRPGRTYNLMQGVRHNTAVMKALHWI